jgi:hypothetical protein
MQVEDKDKELFQFSINRSSKTVKAIYSTTLMG